MERLTRRQASERIGRDWRVIDHALESSFRTGSMAAGAAFVSRIVEAADRANHHPDLRISYPRVDVLITTHDTGGLTSLDVDLAGAISAIAADLGIAADPTAVSRTEIAIDALDLGTVRPFWQVVFGHERTESGDEVVDPAGRHPTIRIRQMDEARAQRNRVHLDLRVPHDVVEDRLAAALAVGGRLVSDAYAPSFWVLADPEGNEVCLCTWHGRD